jgi:hypothetical protein
LDVMKFDDFTHVDPSLRSRTRDYFLSRCAASRALTRPVATSSTCLMSSLI